MTIVNGGSSSTVTIDTSTKAAGTYSLVLESYDTSNYPNTTHKTDIVTIIVYEYTRLLSIASFIVILKGS